MERWLGHGYGAAQAREKTEANDLVNARAVIGASVEPDLRIGMAAGDRAGDRVVQVTG